MSSVRVLYDFTAEDANELTVMRDEVLTVINPNMFDGWIQVRNTRGLQGIVPSTYVEYTSGNQDDDDIPPPPSSSGSSALYGFGSAAAASSTASTSAPPPWNLPTPAPTYINQDPPGYTPGSFDFDSLLSGPTTTTTSPTTNSTSFMTNTASSSIATDLDDFFGGASSSFSNNKPTTTTTTPTSPTSFTTPSTPSPTTNTTSSFSAASSRPSGAPGRPPVTNSTYDHSSSDFSSDEGGGGGGSASKNNNNQAQRNNSVANNSASGNTLTSSGTIGKASSKVKNTYGLDAFLLRGALKPVPESDRLSSIILNEQRLPVWRRISPPYQVVILGYHADKKYHGVKKFTSYEIQAKIFPQKVNRRYNHFDWLHERLVEKYPNLCIPPLPGKAVTGNFEDEFIAKRKSQLELWLNRMAAHPVIGQSEVFIHFLQSEENSSKWKAGKRKAEKDEYRGAQWFCTLTVPAESVDTTAGIRERVDKFAKAAIMLDSGVKNVTAGLDKIASLNANAKKEYNNLGKRLEEFGLALGNDALDAPNNSQLSTALITAGNTFNQIGNIYGEQPKVDISPLMDRLGLYRGIIQQMPEIVSFEKSSIASYEEFQQRPEKLEGRTLIEIAPRREIISHVTFSEINLFNSEKVDDMATYFKSFLQQQIAFYSEITECLKRAQANFDRIPITSPTYTANPSGSVRR